MSATAVYAESNPPGIDVDRAPGTFHVVGAVWRVVPIAAAGDKGLGAVLEQD